MERGKAEGTVTGEPAGNAATGSAAGSWYAIRMSEKDARRGKAERLVRDIYDIFCGIDRDPGIAVFSSIAGDGFVEVFFSPAASSHAGAIIKIYRGSESSGPTPGARLLLGSNEICSSRTP